MEYLASIRLLDLCDGEVLLDAGGGATAEFALVARDYTGRSLELLCQDLRATEGRRVGVRFLHGDLGRIDLPDASVDAVACHQTLQLLRGDADRRFLAEAARVLKPGGRLVVVPILVANRYAEIRNGLRRPRRDAAGPATIHDPTAACAGWGPHSGFSRVLDPAAFAERVLGVLRPGFHAAVHRVLVAGVEAPDLARNRNLPRFNGAMKALTVRRLT